jgi:F-type H+-transporting ATPase subunit c
MMKKTFAEAVLVIFSVLFSASLAAAAEAAAPGSSVDYTKAIVVGCSLIAVGLAMGLGTIGTGVGMGHGLSGATNAVGRNPEAQGKDRIPGDLCAGRCAGYTLRQSAAQGDRPFVANMLS